MCRTWTRWTVHPAQDSSDKIPGSFADRKKRKGTQALKLESKVQHQEWWQKLDSILTPPHLYLWFPSSSQLYQDGPQIRQCVDQLQTLGFDNMECVSVVSFRKPGDCCSDFRSLHQINELSDCFVRILEACIVSCRNQRRTGLSNIKLEIWSPRPSASLPPFTAKGARVTHRGGWQVRRGWHISARGTSWPAMKGGEQAGRGRNQRSHWTWTRVCRKTTSRLFQRQQSKSENWLFVRMLEAKSWFYQGRRFDNQWSSFQKGNSLISTNKRTMIFQKPGFAKVASSVDEASASSVVEASVFLRPQHTKLRQHCVLSGKGMQQW